MPAAARPQRVDAARRGQPERLLAPATASGAALIRVQGRRGNRPRPRGALQRGDPRAAARAGAPPPPARPSAVMAAQVRVALACVPGRSAACAERAASPAGALGQYGAALERADWASAYRLMSAELPQAGLPGRVSQADGGGLGGHPDPGRALRENAAAWAARAEVLLGRGRARQPGARGGRLAPRVAPIRAVRAGYAPGRAARLHPRRRERPIRHPHGAGSGPVPRRHHAGEAPGVLGGPGPGEEARHGRLPSAWRSNAASSRKETRPTSFTTAGGRFASSAKRGSGASRVRSDPEAGRPSRPAPGLQEPLINSFAARGAMTPRVGAWPHRTGRAAACLCFNSGGARKLTYLTPGTRYCKPYTGGRDARALDH